MPRNSASSNQLALPGMASHCPHCGSTAVMPSDDQTEEAVTANEWICRKCNRVWWQMAPDRAGR